MEERKLIFLLILVNSDLRETEGEYNNRTSESSVEKCWNFGSGGINPL